MPQNLSRDCTPLMFVDNTKFLVFRKSLADLAGDSYIALNMDYEYCHGNNVLVNTDKPKLLAFGRIKGVPSLPDMSMETQTK